MRRRAAAAMAAALVGLATTAACSSGSPVAPDPATRVLVVSLPGVAWADVRAGALPGLEALAGDAAVGDLSTRIGRRAASPSEAYLTIGAGTRAVEPATGGGGLALEPDEPYGNASARHVLLRRLGVATEGIGYLSIGATHDANAASTYGAEVGRLGDELDRAGVARAVVANADGTEGGGDDPGYDRSAATALMDSKGVVTAGTVGRSLLAADPTAPFGVRLDPEAVEEAFTAAWDDGPGRRVVLVEASDLTRVEAYRDRSTPAQQRRLRAEALGRADALLTRLLRHVDLDRDAVVVLSPVSPPGSPDLGVVAVQADGSRRGLLRSATTRRDGYVQLADVAPTILDLLGEDAPDDIEGRAFRVSRDPNGDRAVRHLARAVDEAQFRADMLPVVTLGFVAVLGVLVLLKLFGSRLGVGDRSVGTASLAVLGAVPGSYLAALVPPLSGRPLAYLAFVAGVGGTVAAAARLTERRWPGTAAVVALGAVVLVVTADVASGAALQVNTVFGYSVAVAGRFAGLGNLAFALLSSAGLVLAVLLADRFGPPGRRAAIALLVVIVLVDGLPVLGSDVGGVLAMVPAFTTTMLLVGRRRVGWREGLVMTVAAVTAVFAFAFVDLARPEAARTHLARLAEHVVHLRWDSIGDSLSRRWQASFGSTALAAWAALAFLFTAVGIYLVVAARQRRRGQRPDQPRQPLAAGATGLALLAGLGLIANDSSFAVPGLMLVVVVPVLLLSGPGRASTLAGEPARP